MRVLTAERRMNLCVYGMSLTFTYLCNAVLVSDIFLEINTDSRSLGSTSFLKQRSVPRTWVHLINIKHVQVRLYPFVYNNHSKLRRGVILTERTRWTANEYWTRWVDCLKFSQDSKQFSESIRCWQLVSGKRFPRLMDLPRITSGRKPLHSAVLDLAVGLILTPIRYRSVIRCHWMKFRPRYRFCRWTKEFCLSCREKSCHIPNTDSQVLKHMKFNLLNYMISFCVWLYGLFNRKPHPILCCS
jgi:hypothetical protein